MQKENLYVTVKNEVFVVKGLTSNNTHVYPFSHFISNPSYKDSPKQFKRKFAANFNVADPEKNVEFSAEAEKKIEEILYFNQQEF